MHITAQLSLQLGNAGVVALAADNGDSWLAADLACLNAGKPCVPLPTFFTRDQLQWAVDSAGVDTLLTDQPALPVWHALGFSETGQEAGRLHRLTRVCTAVALPANTAKITFTSGSTGNPKGVCLSRAAQEAVASSIAGLMTRLGIKRYLCALPLPVLLENVAGAYAARLANVECIVPSLSSIGWNGSSQWDPAAFLRYVQEQHIHSAIVLPQMLKSLLPLLAKFDVSSLKLLAVGGARVAPDLLEAARKSGLPVYEGYGLSECGSVVCFNHPDAEKPGTVGKPLAHASVRINGEGELEVAGGAYEGYLGQQSAVIPAWLPTGDLASIDSDGFVAINGRKKNLIISSYGRNISPEWVESELLAQPGILQVAVFGEARPALAAVLFAPGLSDVALQEHVDTANNRLPDYARVKYFIRAAEPFSASNGLATSNGRNKRDAIADMYKEQINSLYKEETTV
jgi:long-chain acyl-CoA synthetase